MECPDDTPNVLRYVFSGIVSRTVSIYSILMANKKIYPRR